MDKQGCKRMLYGSFQSNLSQPEKERNADHLCQDVMVAVDNCRLLAKANRWQHRAKTENSFIYRCHFLIIIFCKNTVQELTRPFHHSNSNVPFKNNQRESFLGGKRMIIVRCFEWEHQLNGLSAAGTASAWWILECRIHVRMVTCTLKVTPARAKALKSPCVPSTGLRTKPSLLALMSYSRSLWSGPTLEEREKRAHVQHKTSRVQWSRFFCARCSKLTLGFGTEMDRYAW